MAICQSESSAETSYPKWVTKGGKDAFKRIEDFSNKSTRKYPAGKRVADLTAPQKMGIGALTDYYAGGPDPNVYGDVSGNLKSVAGTGINKTAWDMVSGAAKTPGDAAGRSMVSQAASAGPQSVATERIVDEGGRLGAISDYMNPYLDQVLNPALREIDKGSAAERKRIGDVASSGSAFGDARHGVLEGELGERTNRARGDVTGNIYAGGFDTAMALRSGDVDRLLSTDITNAQFAEQALGRKMTGGRSLFDMTEAELARKLAGGESLNAMTETALNRKLNATGAMSDAADAEQARVLQRLQALLTGGAIQQQTAQNKADAKYEEFLRKEGDPYDRFQLLLSALNGTPVNRTVTSSQPDNSLLSLLGAGAGALLPV